MTKQKSTPDDIDMTMQESDFDSGESDFDDSCDDANWDRVPLSSDSSDVESDEPETEAAAMDKDGSVTAASVQFYIDQSQPDRFCWKAAALYFQ